MSKKSFSFISLAAMIFVATITFDSLSHADDYVDHHEEVECYVCHTEIEATASVEVEKITTKLYFIDLELEEYLLAINFNYFLTRAPPQR